MMVLRRSWRPFLVFTGVGVLLFSYHYLDDLAGGHHGTFLERLIEATGVYAIFILWPLVVFCARRLPWAAQILGALAFTFAHTTMMALERAVLFPLAGLGHYDYGIMLYRYPMEASQDIIAYGAMVALIYFYDRTEAAQAAQMNVARLQTELAQAKLENLRLQLHPHFLFNTLNFISSVMYDDVRTADAMLARLSEFLRVVLATSDTREITVDEELQIERLYVDIMKARLENALQLQLQVDPDARLARVPPLLLQPIIENAIRHGMADGRTTMEITIRAAVSGGRLEIRVTNDGVAFLGEPDNGGHGLANVRSRLAHLHAKSAQLRIVELQPEGTEVWMELPFAT